MILRRIGIYNFRSIKQIELDFDHQCLILLGKNEAGKSNILKAIAALFGEYSVSVRDKRKKIGNEVIPDGDYFISGEFELMPEELDIIYHEFIGGYGNIRTVLEIQNLVAESFIKELCKSVILELELEENSSAAWCYSGKSASIAKSIAPLFLLGNDVNLNTGSSFDLIGSLYEIVIKHITEKQIRCHYWQYSESYLLPNSVDIQAFKTNPEKYPALANLFYLCGRDNIKKEFENAISQDGDYSNLLDQISMKVTRVFQSIWNDLKGTSIQLRADGGLVLIKIRDKVNYNCEDRSDGFKKFISILLMLSSTHRSNKLGENDLILIDEPDQSLYPTSARFLRDELLQISTRSKIIFSTHSQYMIDTANLDRHLIVEKHNDITSIRREDRNAPFSTDELLRRAIGAGIFEVIKNRNIIFEGYHDKLLFEKYLVFTGQQELFSEVGRIYLKGISGIDPVISILDSAEKKFLVVSDSDSTSLSKRGDFEKDHPEYRGLWVAYSDIVEGIETVEDFINENIVEQVILKAHPDYRYNPNQKAIWNIEKASKQTKQELKNELLRLFVHGDIKGQYQNLVMSLFQRTRN